MTGLLDTLGEHGYGVPRPVDGHRLRRVQPLGDWVGIILGLSFCLSFGYWTTNFAEVQRAFAAKDGHAARLTPIIGAFPKTSYRSSPSFPAWRR